VAAVPQPGRGGGAEEVGGVGEQDAGHEGRSTRPVVGSAGEGQRVGEAGVDAVALGLDPVAMTHRSLTELSGIGSPVVRTSGGATYS
jgi:hypothetical protein